MKKKIKTLFIAVMLLAGITLQPFSSIVAVAATPLLEVIYFSVGHGDCALIKSNGYTILVDSGEWNSGISDVKASQSMLNGTTIQTKTKSNLRGYLRENGTLRNVNGKPYIDYVIITHYDSDHIGGLFELLGYNTPTNSNDDIQVGKFISRKYSENTLERLRTKAVANSSHAQYRNYMKIVNAIGYNGGMSQSDLLNLNTIPTTSEISSMITKIKKRLGDSYNWDFPAQGDNIFIINDGTTKLSMQFLHKSTTYITEADVANDTLYGYAINRDSLMFMLNFTTSNGTKKFLFAGDAGDKAFKNMKAYADKYNINLKTDVFKLTHHGYSGSVPSILTTDLKPTVSIVSIDTHKLSSTKMKGLIHFDTSGNYKTDSTLKNTYGEIYETWAIESYLSAGNRNHNFVGINILTNGGNLIKNGEYYDNIIDAITFTSSAIAKIKL